MGKIRGIFKNRRGKALFLSAFFLAFGLALFIPKQMKALSMGTKGELFIILRKHQKYNGTYGIYTDFKPLSDGSVGYCLDSRKAAPPDGTPLYETNDSMPHKALVAMKLGYPHRSWYNTGNAQMDRDLNMYVTQCAIWGFQDGFGPNEVAKFYKAPDITDKYENIDIEGFKQNIINFMHEVNNYNEPLDPAIWVDKTSIDAFTENSGGWLTTPQISTGGRGVSGNIQVEVEGAPAGTVVKDGWSYNETNQIAVGRPFYLDMPLQSQGGSFRVRLKAVGQFKNIKTYTSNNAKYQRIGTYKEEQVNRDLYTPYITVNYGASLGTMQVFKTDAENGVRLPGATIQVTGPNGFNKTVTTDGNGQYWFGNLQAGTYTAKEISAPDGYEVNSTPQSTYLQAGGSGSITITDNKQKLAMLQIEKLGDDGNHLQGARFKVIKEPEGKEVADITTYPNGSVYIEKLQAGRYTIKEIEAPQGYDIDRTPKEVSFYVNPGDTTNFKKVTVTNHKKTGELEVIKKGADGKFLQGAEFTVTRKSDGHVMGKITTGSDGKAVMNNLTKGTYKVVETKAPTGYLLSNDSEKEVTLFADSNDTTSKHSLTFVNNQVKATAKILKVDGDTGKPLTEGEFKITGPNGYQVTKSPNSLGFIELKQIVYGDYKIEEIEAPTGYVKGGPWNFSIRTNGDTHSVRIENHKIHGNIDLTKVDSQTKKPIPGVQFRIDGPNNYRVEKTTDDKGKIRLENLVFGEYHITELKPAEGYLANTTTHRVNVDTNGKTYNLTVENKIQSGGIEITKIDKETKKPIPGVEFNITGPEGFNKTATTNAKGVITLEDTRYGNYTIREIKPAPGYLANNNTYSLKVVEAGKLHKISIDNDISRGNIKITKVDIETKKTIPNVEFNIKGPDGYNVTKTTDSNGVITLDNVRYGDYTVTETRPGAGYIANPKTHTIQVREQGKLYAITVENKAQKGVIKITKVDSETNKPIPGVEFNITGPENYNVTKTTDSKGIILLEEVRVGEYTVKETKPAPGYLANSKVNKINVTKNGQTFELSVSNDIQRGNIKLLKKDQDLGIAIPGVTFNITGPEGYNVTKETNKEGLITLENLRYGVYHIKETKPATGYQVNSKTWDVDVNAHGKTFELEVTNKTIEGEIVIEKKDAAGNKPLEGAEFQIRSLDFRVDGNIPVVNQKLKTDAQGRISVPNLRFGNYEIKEVQPPVGYVLDPTVQKVNIDGSKPQYKVEFTNKKAMGKLEILKADKETGEALEGAEFSITGLTDTTYNKTVKTGADGKVRVEGIPYGEYKVVETKAPVSHVLDTTEHTFNIDKDGKEVKIKHLNRINKGYVEIIKTDNETHEKLGNAKFEIYDKAGTKVQTLVTNEDGYAKSGLLNYGDYTMKEVQPPTGYNPNPKVYNIQIREEGKTYTYSIENSIIKGKIKIVKVDALDRSIPVSDVEFSVWKEGQDPSKDKALHVMKTDKNGEAITPDLRYGKYFIKETATRDDYYNNEGKWEVFVETNGKTYIVNVDNKPVTAKIKIHKTSDQTGKDLANAKFQIIDNKTNQPVSFSMPGEDGKVVPTTTFVSDDKGVIEIPTELRYGSYTLVEVEPPTGFLVAEPIPFEVNKQSPFVDKDGDKWLEFNPVDKIIRGNVELLKTSKDAPDTKMVGVVFELIRVTNPEKHELGKVGEYTTDNDGKIVVNDLPYGEYYFKEIKTLEGYKLDETPIHFMVQENGKIINLGMDNRWIRGDVELTKTDIDTKETIEGVTFELYRHLDKDTELVEECKTDNKGQLHIKDLPYGKYELVEKETLENYVLDKTPQEFFIQEDKGVVKLSMTNEKIKGDLQITKTDVADGKALPNAGFKIYKEDKKTVVAEGRTDEKGVAYFEKLIYGKYYYQEFDAPEGYVIDESLFPFEIKEDGKVIKAEMTNEKIKGTLELTKLDISDGELLPNAHFAVFKNEGTKEEPKKGDVVVKGVTDEKGLCTLENIEYGKYLYQEFEAPEGYVINDALMPFEIKENGDIIKSQVPNRKITGDLKVLKVDKKDDKPLEGAYFEVYKKDDKEGKQPLFKGTTDKNGTLEFKGVIYGDYYVKEVRPPEGYTLENNNSENFSIKANEDKTEVKFKNSKIELPQTGAVKTYAVIGLGITVIGGSTLVLRRKK